MRRLASVLLFSLVVVASTSSSAGALAGQLAFGSGVDNQGGTFAFLARGTGTGADATGTFQYTLSGLTLAGDVSCMIVATSTRWGRVADVRGFITQSSDSSLLGQAFDFVAEDFTPDGFSLDSIVVAPPPCVTPAAGAAAIASGSVTILGR